MSALRFRHAAFPLRIGSYVIALFIAVAMLAPCAQAQAYSVLHSFTNGSDGAVPVGYLAIDAAGNLYGTTVYGGTNGLGTVFQLKKQGSNWTLNTLYTFAGGDDGAYPRGGVVIGGDGTLYGTTTSGGGSAGGGTVYQLRPRPATPPSTSQPWNETVLFRFTDDNTGLDPVGNLTLDAGGNLYGVTFLGGYGVVWELQKSQNGWTEVVLYTPSGGEANPSGGVTFDRSGNLYTTFSTGGSLGCGTVDQIVRSGSGWSGHIIYNFHRTDGCEPLSQLILDPSGSLVGNTSYAGPNLLGTTFKLTPDGNSWDFELISTVLGSYDRLAGTLSDTLYGTSFYGSSGSYGEVYKLTRSGFGYNFVVIHGFNSADGANPWAGVTLDGHGNLFGTTEGGGSYDAGVIWKITP